MDTFLQVQAMVAGMKSEGMSDEVFYQRLACLVVEPQPFCIELNGTLFHDPESRMIFATLIRSWEGDNLKDVPHIRFGFKFDGEGYLEQILLYKNTAEYKSINIKQNEERTSYEN